MSQKIYIVEDDASIRELESYALKSAGFETLGFENSRDFFAQMESHLPDLILLDIMLPGTDGLKVLETIRSTPAYSKLPVILVTAKTGEIDAVKGLDSGADDYITKPFNPLELVARVKTQLRRSTRYNQPASAPAEVQEYDFRGLQISKTNHKCILFGDELSLTPLEFSILWYLCQHRGAVVSSEELFQAVWGERYMDGNNTVMTHIARLREKMHEPSRKPKFIKTVWGVGYTIE